MTLDGEVEPHDWNVKSSVAPVVFLGGLWERYTSYELKTSTARLSATRRARTEILLSEVVVRLATGLNGVLGRKAEKRQNRDMQDPNR